MGPFMGLREPRPAPRPRRPAWPAGRRALPRLLLVALLFASGPLLANSLAAHFDGHTMQAVSLLDSSWTGFSSPARGRQQVASDNSAPRLHRAWLQGTTIEAWVKFNNPNARWSTLINYSTLTPLSKVGSPKEVAFDVGSFVTSTAMSWQRQGELVVCFQCGNAFSNGHWNHIVSTLDYTTGDTSYYVNGTLLTTMPGLMASDIFRTVPRSGGAFVLGLGLASSPDVAGRVIVNQLASHSLDDIRVHDRVLSASEVAAGAWRLPGDMPDSYGASLKLHWRFDSPDASVEQDLSGNQAHGLRGAVDNAIEISLTYRDNDNSMRVAKPAMVQGLLQDTVLSPMNTTLFAPGPQLGVDIPIRPANESLDIMVTSLAESAGQLLWTDASNGSTLSLQAGQVLSASGQLSFQSPDMWQSNGSATAVELSYQFGGQELSLIVVPPPTCAAPGRSFSGIQAVPVLLSLGNICGDGVPVVTQILSPPSRGKLHQFLPNRQLWPFFYPLEPQSIGEEISTFPFDVSNPWGALVFIDADLSPTLNYDVTMEYRWLSPSASDASANVTIALEYVSKPPELEGASFIITGRGEVQVQLQSTSSGLTAPGEQSQNRYRIHRAPAFGNLYQMLDDQQSTGAQISSFGESTVFLKQYADEVPPYSAQWGPAVSSSGGFCPECCTYKATCNPKDCAAVGREDFNTCVMDSAVDNILGPPPPNWPNVDTELYSTLGWRPDCLNCGPEFVVVGFATPLHVTSVEITELTGAGSVVGISLAAEYKGNQTEWVSVWSGPTQDVPDIPRTFAPAICPVVGLTTKWVRLDMDTAASSAAERITSVALLGTVADRTDVVVNADGILVYRPTPGVSMLEGAELEDSFDVVVSDCSADSSSPQTVAVPVEDWRAAASATDDSFFGSVQQTEVFLGETSEVRFSLDEAAGHLSAGYGTPIDPKQFSIAMVPSACFDVSLADGSGTIYGAVSDGTKSTDQLGCEELNQLLQPSEPLDLGTEPCFLLQPVQHSVTTHSMSATATALNVSYTLRLEVVVKCPPSASIYDCADGPEVCAADGSDAVGYDPIQRACIAPSSESASTIAIKAAAGLLASAVAIGTVLACWYNRFKARNRLRDRGGPPGKGEMVTLVITDIQGSTTLWDKYPEQMAKDIALHHTVLRRSLSNYSGYEVATEGDSFKCAFSNPEDALLWCMVVQMELLEAPWTPELVEGGAEMLNHNASWASDQGDCQLPAHCLGIIDAIVLKTSVDHGRKSSFQQASSKFAPFKFLTAPIKAAAGTRRRQQKRLPAFRGLRVRMGVHTGVADTVHTHENTHRTVYGGKVAAVAKAVSDTPCGGQIIITGETMAAISSTTALAEKANEVFGEWNRSNDGGTAGMAIMHLGAHIITNRRPPSVIGPPSDAAHLEPKSQDMPATGSGEVEPHRHKFLPPLKANRVAPMAFSAVLEEEQAGSPSVSITEAEPAAEDDRDVEGDEETALLVQPQEILETQQTLERTSELLMVLPLPIWQRALCASLSISALLRYYPPPSSLSQLTPAWHEAPKCSDVTILFSFIDAWDMIKQMDDSEDGEVTKEALQQHNATVRALLILHRGYEMEGEDGNFVTAFHTPMDALEFSMKLQFSLMCVPWSNQLLDVPMAQPMLGHSGQLIFRGLRVRVGMCTGKAVTVQVSQRTGRIEYYGPIMNHAARVAVTAKGGQVLLHKTSWTCLAENFADRLESEDSILFMPRGELALKGIAQPVAVTQAVPAELQDREAAGLRNTSTKQLSVSVPVGVNRFLSDDMAKSYIGSLRFLPV